MVVSYATVEDLRSFAGEGTVELLDVLQATKLERLLTYTSRVIRHVTRAARYPTGNDYVPILPEHTAAFREATILHVLSIVENGLVDDVLSGGVQAEADVSATSENGASLSFDNTARAVALARLRSGMLVPEAESVLRDAGLLGGLPLMYF